MLLVIDANVLIAALISPKGITNDLIFSPEKDVEYLAVALSRSCPLWSNDKRLKSQKEVKVLSTPELIQFLS